MTLELIILIVLLLFLAFVGLNILAKQPSLSGDWYPDQELLPDADLQEDKVHIKNIRNINYRSHKDYDIRYFDKAYKVDDLCAVWFIVDYFDKKLPGMAHTMISFEFNTGEFLVISVEVRRRKGQRYSPIKGLLRHFEIMYVVATEFDAIRLRTNIRKHDVFLYPVETTKEKIKALFLNIMKRVHKLHEEPEFYNTFRNSCSTNLAKHIRTVTPGRIPRSFAVLLPGYSDGLAYKIGLIKGEGRFKDIRKKHLITSKAHDASDEAEFSQKIREF